MDWQTKGRGFVSHRGQANFLACPVGVLRVEQHITIYMSVCIITICFSCLLTVTPIGYKIMKKVYLSKDQKTTTLPLHSAQKQTAVTGTLEKTVNKSVGCTREWKDTICAFLVIEKHFKIVVGRLPTPLQEIW